jgi:hypothetical protein
LKVATVLGFAKRTVHYNSDGKIAETAFLGPDNRLMINEQLGVAKIVWDYDAHGNQIGTAFFGPDNQLMINETLGYAKATARYDERGNVLEKANFDEGSQLVRSKADGCAKTVHDYDKRNNQIESVCLGVDGVPIDNNRGYATFRGTYDEQGVPRSCSYTNANGHSVKPQGQVRVVGVLENSQAERLDLQFGDVITAYNQMAINADCEFLVAANDPGDGLRMLAIKRAGQVLTFPVQPGKLGIRIIEAAVTTEAPESSQFTKP